MTQGLIAAGIWVLFVYTLYWAALKLQTHIWNTMLNAPPPDESSTKRS